MNSKHRALVLISVDLVAGLPNLQRIIQALSHTSAISSVSSVYKKYLNQRSEDLNSLLILAVQLSTELNQQEAFVEIRRIEADFQSQSLCSMSLLAYDADVRVLPGQNLPHPQLHTDDLTLRCASEAWGDYLHPILKKTLNEMTRSLQPLKHVEFFAQGRSLVPAESLL